MMWISFLSPMRTFMSARRDLVICKCKRFLIQIFEFDCRISSLNEFRYNLPYSEMTGGAIAISADQFRTVNGFSNIFFGWGGEDDEFYHRLAYHGLQPVRYHPSLARYVSLKHLKQSQHSNVNIKTAMSQSDGLNSLNYSVHSIQYLSQFTLIQVYL